MAEILRVVRLSARMVHFDLDGVLVDSTAAVEKSWAEWAASNQIDADDLLKKVHGRKAEEVLLDYVEAIDIAAHMASLVASEIKFASKRIVPGARELCCALPIDTWSVVTSAPRELAISRLVDGGLPVPRVLVCAEDVRRGKPAPEGFLRAADLAKCEPERCLVIEDAPAGIAAGKAAGMRVLALAFRWCCNLTGGLNTINLNKLHSFLSEIEQLLDSLIGRSSAHHQQVVHSFRSLIEAQQEILIKSCSYTTFLENFFGA
jgi:sugar-phosphatase